VARYFLIQYKRAQEPADSQAKSGIGAKSNSKAGAAAAAPSEKTAVGWQTRGLGAALHPSPAVAPNRQCLMHPNSGLTCVGAQR